MVAILSTRRIDVSRHDRVERRFLAVAYDPGSDFAATLQDSHDGGLIFSAGTSDALIGKLSGHVEADETFIGGKARNMNRANSAMNQETSPSRGKTKVAANSTMKFYLRGILAFWQITCSAFRS